MAWTTPRTWVAGEVLTAALLDTHLRDNLAAAHGAALPRVRATASSTAGIAHNTNTLVVFDAETFDTDTMHDNSTNPSRITFTTAGLYQVVAVVSWSIGGSVGALLLDLRKNSGGSPTGGTDLAQRYMPHEPTTYNSVLLSHHEVFAAGDYVEVFRKQESGSTIPPVGAVGGNAITVVQLASD